MDNIRLHYGSVVASLARTLEKNDRAAFFASLDDLVRAREGYVLEKLGELTINLQGALERFCLDSRIVDLAEKEVPDARARLERVLHMTDAAAHRTMDLIEDACPPAERISQLAAKLVPLWKSAREAGGNTGFSETVGAAMDGFLEDARKDADYVQQNLKQMLITQEYQDLSGQIIRGVMSLIGELEDALKVLAALTRGTTNGVAMTPAVETVEAKVSGQSEIDSLLSNFNL